MSHKPILPLLCLALALALLAAVPHTAAANTVFISEFVAEQLNSYPDEDGDYEDWLELHNPTAAPLDLTGWYLTDDPTNLTQWQLPALSLNPGAYQVVFASGKDRTAATLHTNFKLSLDGDYLALVQPDGATIAYQFAISYPPQRAGYAYGTPEGTAELRYMLPTPGTANTAATFLASEQQPLFSAAHGFYDAPFNLTIVPFTPGGQIYYTADGSTPTAASTPYTAPIPITQTTTIRATAVATGHITSTVATQSYLFLDDIIYQYADGTPPTGWPANQAVNGQYMNYGMDPDITNNYTAQEMKDALTSISTISIVTDLPNMVDPAIGIYTNATLRGFAWERPASIELLWPDGTQGFQINAGLRIRGGYSRNDANPKHAFRFFFRDGYDDGDLLYPMFGDEGASQFANLDLRTSQNYSWSFGNDNRNTFLRDVFWRDIMRHMGQPYTRSRYHHLYINGVYWGIYMTEERPEAAFGETYLGGDADNYDTIKAGGSSVGYFTEATDGDVNGAWADLWQLGRTQYLTPTLEGYMGMQGLNVDGTRNPAEPVLLDADNLIDYMISLFYVGAADNALSWFLSSAPAPNGRNSGSNNWFALRDRTNPEMGFQFFAHDGEHSAGVQANSGDPTFNNRVSNPDGSPFRPDQQGYFTRSNPQFLHQDLLPTAEYRINFADRAHQYFFNNGLLTPPSVVELIQPRRDVVAEVILAEAARWGDSRKTAAQAPFTPSTWNTAANNMVNYLTTGYGINGRINRTEEVLNQLRLVGLYPTIQAPVFNQHGGLVETNFELAMTAQPTATIYYMLDGRDPRQIGGAIHPEAQIYTGTFPFGTDAQVRARAWIAGEWSALNQADFTLNNFVPPTPGTLAISEIHYNPAGVDDYEFLELTNIGTQRLDLQGVQILGGVSFTITGQILLDVGQQVIFVESISAFGERYKTPSSPWYYPNIVVGGQWSGALSNSGEELYLRNASDVELLRLTYADGGAWPGRADGNGSAAELSTPLSAPTTQPALDTYLNTGANWRPTSEYHGSPGRLGLGPDNRVLFNEILANSTIISPTLELYNTTAAPLDISYWFISDSTVYTKFQIYAGQTVTANGYLTFTVSDFNNPVNAAEPFPLNPDGGDLYLLEADSAGNLLRFVERATYPASRPAESVGYLPDGQAGYVRLCTPSLGASNLASGFCHGPVVINELHYNPSAADDTHLEYVELLNASAQPEDLTGWRLRGDVDFDFGSLILPADGLLLLVDFDPANAPLLAAFRATYDVPAGVPILGPWTDGPTLNDDTGIIRLDRPHAPGFWVEDTVTYDDTAPWPTAADGQGPSLELIDPALDNRDGANWTASLNPTGTAGRPNNDDNPAISAADLLASEGTTTTLTVTLAHASGLTVTVEFATASGTAVTGVDYTAASGTLTFPPGTTSQPIPLTLLDDATDEPDETFSVALTNPNHATVATSAAVVTISDDDDPPTLTIGPATAVEGALQLSFPVTLTAASGFDITLSYATADDTALAGADYEAAVNGQITLTAGITQSQLLVTMIDDGVDEPAETLWLTPLTATHAVLDTTAALGTITDDDDPPLIDMGAGMVLEGETAVVSATLRTASAFTITVDYATADASATAGTDYTPISGTLTFAPGTTSQPITVTALTDGLDEPQETFTLTLSNPLSATLGTAAAAVEIVDIDGDSALSLADAQTAEGDSGATLITVTVNLLPASGQTVQVDYATAAGTASAGADYTPISGTLTFAPGQTSHTVTIAVAADTLHEGDETLALVLSNPVHATLGNTQAVLTIQNDDAAPTTAVSPLALSAAEGDAGPTAVTLTVTLSAASGLTTTVAYATADGTAVSGVDYTAATGSLTFLPGQTSQTLTLFLLGDTTREEAETFTVQIGPHTILITVLDDDQNAIFLPLVVTN